MGRHDAEGVAVRKALQLGVIEIQRPRIEIAQFDLQAGFHDGGRDGVTRVRRDQYLFPGSNRRKPLEDQGERRFPG